MNTSADIPMSRKEQTHERILEVAARAIRRSGYHGVGVAHIMKEAGLTHGGFYAHFSSRDALLAEAVEYAGRASATNIAQGTALRRAKGVDPFQALVESYLSEQHLNATERGCPVSALASEIPRQADIVRNASTQRVQSLVELVQQVLPAGAAPDSAPAVASTLVGAVQLARALGPNAQGRAVLEASRNMLLNTFGQKPTAQTSKATH